MPNRKQFSSLASKRLKTVKILIKEEDWQAAAYFMGYVLEFALKAKICRNLNLVANPENTSDKRISTFFITHRFDSLLVVSGMENIFTDRGPADAYLNWSQFTLAYPGDWQNMRYDDNPAWNEESVNKLYTHLEGIVKEIRKRW